MDDERDRRDGRDEDGLFGRLSAEGRQLAPVSYRHSQVSTLRIATHLRLVESRPYRATGYVCSPFRKPISKCLSQNDPDDL